MVYSGTILRLTSKHMFSRWKAWLAAGAALLMVGAGCASNVQTGIESGTTSPSGSPTTQPAAEQGAVKGDVSADADAAVNAALKENADETSTSMEENADASVVNNDSAELNAYSQTYDQSQL